MDGLKYGWTMDHERGELHRATTHAIVVFAYQLCVFLAWRTRIHVRLFYRAGRRNDCVIRSIPVQESFFS